MRIEDNLSARAAMTQSGCWLMLALIVLRTAHGAGGTLRLVKHAGGGALIWVSGGRLGESWLDTFQETMSPV